MTSKRCKTFKGRIVTPPKKRCLVCKKPMMNCSNCQKSLYRDGCSPDCASPSQAKRKTVSRKRKSPYPVEIPRGVALRNIPHRGPLQTDLAQTLLFVPIDLTVIILEYLPALCGFCLLVGTEAPDFCIPEKRNKALQL